jgi:hypothetical protein
MQFIRQLLGRLSLAMDSTVFLVFGLGVMELLHKFPRTLHVLPSSANKKVQPDATFPGMLDNSIR